MSLCERVIVSVSELVCSIWRKAYVFCAQLFVLLFCSSACVRVCACIWLCIHSMCVYAHVHVYMCMCRGGFGHGRRGQPPRLRALKKKKIIWTAKRFYIIYHRGTQ